MVNKKGFIRTMEAVIAVLLVLGFLLYVLPRRPVFAESKIPEGIESSRNYILMEFLTNKAVRDCIASFDPVGGSVTDSNQCDNAALYGTTGCDITIMSLVNKHTVPGFENHCEICEGVSPCTSLPRTTIKRSVYPGAVFMYFTGSNVRYVRIYFWKK